MCNDAVTPLAAADGDIERTMERMAREVLAISSLPAVPIRHLECNIGGPSISNFGSGLGEVEPVCTVGARRSGPKGARTIGVFVLARGLGSHPEGQNLYGAYSFKEVTIPFV